MLKRPIPNKTVQPQKVALTKDIMKPFSSVPFIKHFHTTLLNHPDERNLAVSLAIKVFLRLVKLHLATTGELKQIAVREGIKRGMLPQEISDTLTNNRSFHV